MAETINGYLPDLNIGWDVEVARAHLTEITMARSGKEQRRGVWPASGFQRMSATGAGSELHDRRAIAKFFDDRRGRLQAFYFFRPDRQRLFGFSAGTISSTNLTRVVAPATEGSYYFARTNNVANGFTTRALPLRTGGRFAHMFFDAIDASGRIDCGSHENFQNDGNLTIAAWVYPISRTVDGTITGNRTVNASGFLFYLQVSTGKLAYQSNFASSLNNAISSQVIPLNTWTHVAITVNGTAVRFFINGVFKEEITGITAYATATVNYLIGAAPGPANFFDGLISEVRHYRLPHSDADMANIFKGEDAGVGLLSAFLVGWWKLDEGFGTTSAAKDSSGAGSHGTPTGNGAKWHAGEDLIVFNGTQIAGQAVILFADARQRLTGRFDNDELPEGFLQNVASIKGQQRLAIREVR